MPKSEVFHLNYYVGAVLAQGGDMWLENSKIVFSPTSPIDRAMGAKDVEIPFQKIKGAEYKGDLRNWFHINTAEKIHKFQGTQAKLAWDHLKKTIQIKPAPVATAGKKETSAESSEFSCQHCSKPMVLGYSFCPACGTPTKSACASCNRAVSEDWNTCAYCGRMLRPAPKAA